MSQLSDLSPYFIIEKNQNQNPVYCRALQLSNILSMKSPSIASQFKTKINIVVYLKENMY